jgi:hypothetical protein
MLLGGPNSKIKFSIFIVHILIEGAGEIVILRHLWSQREITNILLVKI